MADKRRIIMGTHVVPKEGSLLDPTTGAGARKWIMDNSINTSMGGKFEITSDASEIAVAQTDANWYKGDDKGTEVTFTGPYQLRNSAEADDLKFLYIKNLNASGGTIITVSLAAEGEWNEAGQAAGGAITWNTAPATGVRGNTVSCFGVME
jgi:hypothetical protein